MQDNETVSFGDRTDLEEFLQVNSPVKVKIPSLCDGEVSPGFKLKMASIERDLTIPD